VPETSVAGRPATQPAAPRRERKKRQTREALIHAALELFSAKGYENTAIREITDAVDVSERTFFRYFAGKEDLVLSFVRDAARTIVEALAARPAAEEPLVALCNAFRESIKRLATDYGTSAESGYAPIARLIDSTPTLVAANLRYAQEHSEKIAQVLARREGVDPATDLRPRVLAGTFAALVAAATHEWRTEGGATIESMLAAFDAYAEAFGPALFGHWRQVNPK
jgi:AcrR family transcriptional regulator